LSPPSKTDMSGVTMEARFTVRGGHHQRGRTRPLYATEDVSFDVIWALQNC